MEQPGVGAAWVYSPACLGWRFNEAPLSQGARRSVSPLASQEVQKSARRIPSPPPCKTIPRQAQNSPRTLLPKSLPLSSTCYLRSKGSSPRTLDIAMPAVNKAVPQAAVLSAEPKSHTKEQCSRAEMSNREGQTNRTADAQSSPPGSGSTPRRLHARWCESLGQDPTASYPVVRSPRITLSPISAPPTVRRNSEFASPHTPDMSAWLEAQDSSSRRRTIVPGGIAELHQLLELYDKGDVKPTEASQWLEVSHNRLLRRCCHFNATLPVATTTVIATAYVATAAAVADAADANATATYRRNLPSHSHYLLNRASHAH